MLCLVMELVRTHALRCCFCCPLFRSVRVDVAMLFVAVHAWLASRRVGKIVTQRVACRLIDALLSFLFWKQQLATVVFEKATAAAAQVVRRARVGLRSVPGSRPLIRLLFLRSVVVVVVI